MKAPSCLYNKAELQFTKRSSSNLPGCCRRRTTDALGARAADAYLGIPQGVTPRPNPTMLVHDRDAAPGYRWTAYNSRNTASLYTHTLHILLLKRSSSLLRIQEVTKLPTMAPQPSFLVSSPPIPHHHQQLSNLYLLVQAQSAAQALHCPPPHDPTKGIRNLKAIPALHGRPPHRQQDRLRAHPDRRHNPSRHHGRALRNTRALL